MGLSSIVGSYGTIQRYLKSRRLAARETYVPLDHPPGHRCEADFGHIHVDFPDGRPVEDVLAWTTAEYQPSPLTA